MSDTQILVLTATFLLAAFIVLPITYFAYQKEKRRQVLAAQRSRAKHARELKLKQEDEAERRRKKTAKARKELVDTFNACKDRFREIRTSTYTSPVCGECASDLVNIVELDPNTGVFTAHCVKCGTERRIYALSRDGFKAVSKELAEIMDAYHAVTEYAPDYSSLAVSFPKPSTPSD